MEEGCIKVDPHRMANIFQGQMWCNDTLYTLQKHEAMGDTLHSTGPVAVFIYLG